MLTNGRSWEEGLESSTDFKQLPNSMLWPLYDMG